MSKAPGTSAHLTDETFEAFLLGELSAAERAAIRAHLESCVECRATYGDPELLLASLPFAAPELDIPYDPAASWAGIASRLAEQSSESSMAAAPAMDLPPARPASLAVRPSQPRDRRRVSWIAAASFAVVALILGLLLGQLLPDWRGTDDRQSIPVTIADPNLQAQAVLTYLPKEQVFVLDVSGLPPAPDGYVYQAWLIDTNGAVPSGVLGSGQNQLATHGNRAQFTTFAITLEPGPLGVPAPTSNPILVAELTGS